MVALEVSQLVALLEFAQTNAALVSILAFVLFLLLFLLRLCVPFFLFVSFGFDAIHLVAPHGLGVSVARHVGVQKMHHVDVAGVHNLSEGDEVAVASSQTPHPAKRRLPHPPHSLEDIALHVVVEEVANEIVALHIPEKIQALREPVHSPLPTHPSAGMGVSTSSSLKLVHQLPLLLDHLRGHILALYP